MLRSLFTGITGLRSHQTMLDVTGNNIANVNTTGFKASRTIFEDTLSQLMTSAAGAQGDQGGTNPAQIGLGVKVSAIAKDLTQGAQQQTGRALDMMINGEGYFIVRSDGEQMFTRNGAFGLDASGRLVTSSGALVQGWSAVNGAVDTTGQIGGLTLPMTTTMGARATTSATYRGNLPSDVPQGTQLIRTIDVYDATGNARQLEVTFTRGTTTGNQAEWELSMTDGTATQAGSLTFTDGLLTASTIPAVGGVTLNMTALTGYSGLQTVEASLQNGQSAGVLKSFSLQPDGTLVGVFSNDLRQVVGQLALASFANSGGLEAGGGSMMRESANSGGAQVGVAATGNRGGLSGSSLEMSNVDLSAEFTNMIIAQRGFQANSRVITTSDEVLQELVNLKR